jgi:hypothetical protein
MQITEFDGSANYNSLQLTVRKQMTHGLSLQGAYTWGKDLSHSIADKSDSNVASNLAQQYGRRITTVRSDSFSATSGTSPPGSTREPRKRC